MASVQDRSPWPARIVGAILALMLLSGIFAFVFGVRVHTAVTDAQKFEQVQTLLTTEQISEASPSIRDTEGRNKIPKTGYGQLVVVPVDSSEIVFWEYVYRRGVAFIHIFVDSDHNAFAAYRRIFTDGAASDYWYFCDAEMYSEYISALSKALDAELLEQHRE